MGGSISKKNSEPDRLNKALDVLDAPSAPSTAYPPGGRPSHGGDMELSAIPETPVTSIVAQQQQQQPAAGAGPPAAPAADRQEVVPTVFRWEHGGNHVYITGTFNNWSRKVPMHRSGNDFIYIQSLPKGKHAYKFVVDDEWRFAPDQMTVADTAGNINNFLDLANFQPDDDSMPVRSRADSIPGVYGHILPDEDEYSKEPPLLPPHLRQIVLNAASPDAGDPLQLPTPQHVTLNHLYCTAIKDGLMVQAVTQRYRRKHTTTVFYTVMPMSTTLQGAGAVQPMTASGTVPVAQQQQQQQQQGPQQPPNAGGAPMQQQQQQPQQPSQGGGGVNYGAPQPVRPPPHDGGGGANGMPYEYQQQQLLQQQQQQQMAGRQQQPQQQQQFVQQAQQGSGYAQPQQQQQQQQFQPQSPQQQMQQQYSMAQQQQQRIAAQQQQPPGSGPGPGGSNGAAGSGSGYSYRPPAYPPAPQAVPSGGSATSGASSSSVRSGGNVSSHVSGGGGPAPASGSSSSAAHAAAPPVGGRRGSYNGMPDGSRHESQAYSYAAQVAAAYHAQPGSAPYASGY